MPDDPQTAESEIDLTTPGLEIPAVLSAPQPVIVEKPQLAELLRVSRPIVDRFMREGCPHLALSSRMIRFDLEEVRLWLRTNYGVRRKGYSVEGRRRAEQNRRRAAARRAAASAAS